MPPSIWNSPKASSTSPAANLSPKVCFSGLLLSLLHGSVCGFVHRLIQNSVGVLHNGHPSFRHIHGSFQFLRSVLFHHLIGLLLGGFNSFVLCCINSFVSL